VRHRRVDSSSTPHPARPARTRLSHSIDALERRLLLADISGTKYYDLNRNGARDAGEPGMAGWIVYLDGGTSGAYDGTAVSSADVPKHIPDNGTATSMLSVAGFTGTVQHLSVTLNITHGWDPDLSITLISPTGTHVNLVSGLGGRGHDLDNTTLDDDATVNITDGTAPYTGVFHPVGSLASLYSEDPNGAWELVVQDTLFGFDGSLDSWSLQVNGTEPSTTTNAAGKFTFANLPFGTYDVREIARPGWIVSEPTSGVHSVTLSAAETESINNNFGAYEPPGDIRGRLYTDKNGNGAYDPTDPTLEGWTVYLDTNNNGVKDSSEPSAATDATGNYAFDQITPGTYVVRVQVQSGYTQLSPGPGGALLVGHNRAGRTTTPKTTTAENGGKATKAGTTATTRSSDGAKKFSSTEILANLDGRAALSDLSNFISRNPGTPIRNLFDLSRGKSLQILRTSSRTTLAQLRLKRGVDPQAAVAALQQLPMVRWASLNYVYDAKKSGDPREFTPDDPDYAAQWQHVLMQNDLAWDTTLGSANVTVAITDDGLDLTHPDLAAGVWTNGGEIAGDGIDNDNNGYVDDAHGWDFWNDDNNVTPLPIDMHGTHVVGIVGARTNNATGVAGTAGGITVMPIRFWGSDNSSNWSSAMVARAYAYAVDNGAKIISTSYNVDGFATDPTYGAAVQYIYDHGVLDFNSAGNTNSFNPPRQVYGQTFYVANTDSNDVRNISSNFGYGIDLSAPGTLILSTLPGGGYGYMSGTSMASPNAAGAAALIWSAHPTWTRDQVAAQLIATADNIDAANPNYVGLLGAGRVNSFKAVSTTIAPPKFKVGSLTGLPADGSETLGAPTAFTLDVANIFDPATVNNIANWKLIGAGADGVFNTADDTSVAMTLNGTYQVATNRLSFTITGASSITSGQYRFVATANLKDPFGQSIDGNGDGTGGDAFTRTFTVHAASGAYTVTLAPEQTLDAADFAMFPTSFTGASFTLRKQSGGSATRIDLWIDHDAATDPADFTVDPALLRDTLHFVGTTGDDAFKLDESNGSPIPAIAGAIFSGGEGNDVIRVLGTSAADAVHFHASDIAFGGNFSHEQVEAISFDGAGGADTVAADGGPVVTVEPGQQLASLDISGAGAVQTKPGVELGLITQSLSITDLGTLDLHDSDLIIDYAGTSPLPAIQGLINAARNGGVWTGAGLTSSAARENSSHNTTLAAMESADYPGGGTFDGASPDASSILIKYTYYGDTDFNGAVNFDDYVRTDNGFNNGLSKWLNGDFDGNGQVNFDDYVLIDLAFNTQGVAL
jgi:subtilisin family serine protease/subtilisin-like proprotein convertase family protein